MTTATSTLVAFPVAARRHQVRQAAEMLNSTHGEAATVFWKSLIRSIADQLAAAGIPPEEVRQEVLQFQASVQLELQAIA